jgi:hypothetical protein
MDWQYHVLFDAHLEKRHEVRSVDIFHDNIQLAGIVPLDIVNPHDVMVVQVRDTDRFALKHIDILCFSQKMCVYGLDSDVLSELGVQTLVDDAETAALDFLPYFVFVDY